MTPAQIREEKDVSGCGMAAVMSESGRRLSGQLVVEAMAVMRERTNGRGAGFAGYGIYPEWSDCYAFHLIYETEAAREQTEAYLRQQFSVRHTEPIPTRHTPTIAAEPLLWRYFLQVPAEALNGGALCEEDYVVGAVMHLNTQIQDAFVCSSGKNMGIFKGVGFPEEIAHYFRLEEYQGYIWSGHGRFPTNSVSWWGGAHPFGLLGWSVVHNGEISSYGINKRFLSNFGYECTLFTDTEVLAYLFDLLGRRHGLGFDLIADVLCARFWNEIERLPEPRRELARALRITYGGALVNGPFAIVVGHDRGLVGLTDRIKLRPLVAAREDDLLFVASEECAIRAICPSPDMLWAAKAGEPVVGELRACPGRGPRG